MTGREQSADRGARVGAEALRAAAQDELDIHPAPWTIQREGQWEWSCRDADGTDLGWTCADYLTAADPATVLALLDRLEAAEATVARAWALQRELAYPDTESIAAPERANRRIVASELRAALGEQGATNAEAAL